MERDINRLAKLAIPNVETASPEASNAEFLTCCGERNPVSCNAPDGDELISTVSNGYGRL